MTVACNVILVQNVTCNTFRDIEMATTEVNTRVQKHRDALRAAGLRPVQIWVPDTRRPDFEIECQRQCRIAAQSDLDDSDTQDLMNQSLADLGDWT